MHRPNSTAFPVAEDEDENGNSSSMSPASFDDVALFNSPSTIMIFVQV